MSFYIILRGPAGAGKTTVAERLVKIYGGYHINIDKVKKSLGLKHSEEEKLKANEVVINKALNYLKQDKVVIMDEVLYYEKQLKQLEQLPFQCYVFSLISPLEECLERNRERRVTKGRKMSDDDVVLVHNLVSKMEKGIEINTYNRSVDETIEEILSHLPKPE
jgi:predicted kinase